MLEQYGVRWQGTRPLARLREAHEVMRRFLADGRIEFQGEFYRYSGLFTAARPVQQRLPLKIGAMKGPGSFRLAGEIADGVHVACAHSSAALSFAARSVREGADRAGRRLDSGFDLCASVLGAISLHDLSVADPVQVDGAHVAISPPVPAARYDAVPAAARTLAQPTVTDGRSPAVVHRRFPGRGTRQRGMRFRRTTRSRRDRPVLPAWLRESPPTDGA